MTLGFRQVSFTPLVLDGVTAPGVATGVIYRWRPTKEYDDGVGTGYVERIWSKPLIINGTAATRDLPVTPTPPTWAVEVMVEVLNDGLGKRSVRVETVLIPAGGSIIEFETLQRVNPATLAPDAAIPTGLEARVATLEALVAQGGGSGGGAPPGTGTAGRYRVGDLEDITPTGKALALVTGVDTPTAQVNARAIIGAAGTVSPSFTGNTAVDDLTVGDDTVIGGDLSVAGAVVIPDGALSVAKVAGLTAALAGKANAGTTPNMNVAVGGAYAPRTASPKTEFFLGANPPGADGSTAGGGGMVPSLDLWFEVP